jgi:chromosome segregation ATPase
MSRFISPALLLIAILASPTLHAQQAQDPMLQRMRDAMKKLAQRITDAETQMVNAQAAQLQAEAALKEMTNRQEATAKELKAQLAQSKDYRDQTQKRLNDLETKLAQKEKSLQQYAEALEKWKQGFEQAKSIAQTKETERVEAMEKALQCERLSQQHERKNRELLALGQEILERYSKFGLGTALMAREPFVGSMRVKFQNYINDYGNRLKEARVNPPVSAAAAPNSKEQTQSPAEAQKAAIK